MMLLKRYYPHIHEGPPQGPSTLPNYRDLRDVLESRRDKVFSRSDRLRGSFICKPTEDNYSPCAPIDAGKRDRIILDEKGEA